MLKKQNQLRSILDQICYHTNRSLMSCSIRSSDPFSFSNGLQSRFPESSSRKFFSFHTNGSCSSNYSFLRIRGEINGGFVLRGSCDSNQPKAGAFAPQRLRHLEFKDDLTDARLLNGRGSSERGNPLGFFDNPLPEKFVVAVDVDEGVYERGCFLLLCFLLVFNSLKC